MIGDILKALRYVNGKSGIDVAEKCFISSSTLSKYEKGNIIPMLKNLEMLAKYYNLNLSDIFRMSEIQDENNYNFMQTCKLVIDFFLESKENDFINDKGKSLNLKK